MSTIFQNNFVKRVFSAIIFIPIFLFLLSFNSWSYLFILGLISTSMLLEFYKMTIVNKLGLIVFFTILNITVECVYFISLKNDLNYIELDKILALIFILIFCIGLFIRPIKKSLEILSYGVFGFVYCTVPFLYIFKISFLNKHFEYKPILALIILIWSIDSGAYFIGKFFGKNKFFSSLSPKKTWEGVIGGISFSILAGFLLYKINILYVKNWLLLSVFTSFSAIIGDLLASLFKRSTDKKDSGKFIPGHGGFIDRFDSFVYSAPLYYIIIYLTS